MITELVDSPFPTELLEEMYKTNESMLRNQEARGADTKNLLRWRGILDCAISIRKASERPMEDKIKQLRGEEKERFYHKAIRMLLDGWFSGREQLELRNLIIILGKELYARPRKIGFY